MLRSTLWKRVLRFSGHSFPQILQSMLYFPIDAEAAARTGLVFGVWAGWAGASGMATSSKSSWATALIVKASEASFIF